MHLAVTCADGVSGADLTPAHARPDIIRKLAEGNKLLGSAS